ncbi:MAG: tRNA (adenosine(37)-N6)-threonylcarbamoyltransferase complex dimerization subunit type 1 TsaB [Desulfobacterales bacterium]|nr:tRNA (adenosine(37)-N6)-threonylcarbamoyltransferase complex dimerization subunit type 1 TsaB [Desulfobacterales bacterium]
MKILAVDTATPTCSVAIIDDEDLVCELSLGRGGTHSAHLLGLIQSALGAARMAAAEVDGFGVTIGPGLVCPLLDARRGEVYYNRFGTGSAGFGPRAADAVGSVEEALAGLAEPCLFVGDGTRLYRDRILAGAGALARFSGEGGDLIRASAVGALARVRLLADPFSDAGRLVPRYVRRADARDPLLVATR